MRGFPMSWTQRRSVSMQFQHLHRAAGRRPRHAISRAGEEGAFSWLLTRPTVASVTAGATSPEQARSNAAGWELTDADLAEVDSILTRAG
jgi:aryl-alcohol dehydrogenase-like predicted oxidoreductase